MLQVVSIQYLYGYVVLIGFNDNTFKSVDFEPFLKASKNSTVKSYLNKELFIHSCYIENGDLVWGKHWDLVFPIDQLHRGFIELPSDTDDLPA